MLGDHFAGPVFTAALELWVAARTDETLLEAVAPLEQLVGRETHKMTVQLLGADESQPGVRELIQATLDLVRGLGPGQHPRRRHPASAPDPRPVGGDARHHSWFRGSLRSHLNHREGEKVSVFDQVYADLTAEGDQLRAAVAGLDDAGWATAVPAEGWTIATTVAHLLWTDEVAVLAAHAARAARARRRGTRWC